MLHLVHTRLAAAVSAIALLAAGPVLAHAHLVASTPAANASLKAAPKEITLTFSEKLVPAFTKAELAMTDHNMKVPVKTAVSKDGKTLTATPQSPLMKGAYKVVWSAASADGHKMKGEVTFKVG